MLAHTQGVRPQTTADYAQRSVGARVAPEGIPDKYNQPNKKGEMPVRASIGPAETKALRSLA